MDRHIRSTWGTVSSMSQINSWTQLSTRSLCINMQRGFRKGREEGVWGVLDRAAVRKSAQIFPPKTPTDDFLIKLSSESLPPPFRPARTPETCSAEAASCPPHPPLIPHLLKTGQHPTQTKSCSLFLSAFLWTALCANYSPFPWQWVAPRFFFLVFFVILDSPSQTCLASLHLMEATVYVSSRWLRT